MLAAEFVRIGALMSNWLVTASLVSFSCSLLLCFLAQKQRQSVSTQQKLGFSAYCAGPVVLTMIAVSFFSTSWFYAGTVLTLGLLSAIPSVYFMERSS